MKDKFLFWFILVAAAAAGAARLLPHPPNFTPVGALSLFVGAYAARKHWWGVFVPLVVMFLSDLAIGFYDWKLMAVVYGSFLLYSFIGLLLLKKKNPAMILLGSMGGAVLFYLATNFAVWAFSPWYEKSFEGLMLSYIFALPFFKATLFGDLFYAAILFGSYEFMQQAFRVFSLAKPQKSSLFSSR